MAAYSAVVSFGQLLKQLLDSDQFPSDCPKPKLESLHGKVSSLQSSLVIIFPAPQKQRAAASELEIEIREAIYAAQDRIEYSVSKSFPSETEESPGDQSSTSVSLEEIITNIDRAEEAAKTMADEIRKDPKARYFVAEDTQSSKSSFNIGSTKIVGQEKDKALVKAELMSTEDKLQVVPISGMAGIGKTTLARSIYEDEEIQKHFAIRSWVTVTQDYNVGEIFVRLLNRMESNSQKPSNKASQGSETKQVSSQLSQSLYETRYLIVIDDMWDENVWDQVRTSFRDDRKGSRILLTTRYATVASYAKKEGFHHPMRTLEPDKSLELLCLKAFGENPCPDDQLKVTGARIAESCYGLPLSLTVVGGLLSQSKSNKVREYWENIADDVNAAVKNDKSADSYKKILALSYIHLPGNLKGCFLYMGVFPEDSEISVYKLINLWVAEGFLAPPQTVEKVADGSSLPSSPTQIGEQVAEAEEVAEADQAAEVEEAVEADKVAESDEAAEADEAAKVEEADHEGEKVAESSPNPPSPPPTLEEVGKEYLESLIQRNLVYVRNFGSYSQIKNCGMHDTLRDLAVQESGKEKFFHSIRKYVKEPAKGAEDQRRVSVHRNILMCLEEVYESTKTIRDARSLLYVGSHHHHPLPFSLTFGLLRVFDAFTVYFIQFPVEIIKLIHLRYLSFTYNGKLPSSISKLQYLQILLVRRQPKIIFVGKPFLPDEIWKMPELRHLLFTESDLPAPSGSILAGQNTILLANLQSLSNVRATCCTKVVIQNMPNLKKLGMWIEDPGAVGFYIDQLQQLEAFKFIVLNPIPGQKIEFKPKFDLPKTLRKLTLSGCGLPWEDIEVIRKLPNLEALKLRELAFQGDNWILEEDDKFRTLKFLLIEYLDFKNWLADYSHFPKLQRLFIKHCYNLEFMDTDLGDIGDLRLIEMVDCSPDAIKWARDIKEIKKDNKDLQVRIYCSWE